MNRKIKTWVYAILLLNIIVAESVLQSFYLMFLLATEIHKTDYFSRTCI